MDSGQTEKFPFEDANVHTPNMLPPVCLRSHWDPEQIIRRTLPQSSFSLGLPLDPRPWTKICLTYTTSSDFEEAPHPPSSLVLPSGGTFYPPSRYLEGINDESRLRRLDRPLGLCEKEQYIPSYTGSLYVPNSTVSQREHVSDRFIEELAFPKACMRVEPYDCRQNAEREAWMRSPRPFNNPTKQDRYVNGKVQSNPIASGKAVTA
jgi:hypothetical protein